MENQKLVTEAKGLSKFFSIKLEIRVMGQLIWSMVWPPEKS